MGMKTAKCAECGIERILGSMTDGVCILCREGETTVDKRIPSSTKNTAQPSGRTDIPTHPRFQNPRSSAAAISTVNKANNFFAVVCAVILMFSLIISAFTEDYPIWAILSVLVLMVFTWLAWASGRMFIGIAQDIRAATNELETIRRKIDDNHQ